MFLANQGIRTDTARLVGLVVFWTLFRDIIVFSTIHQRTVYGGQELDWSDMSLERDGWPLSELGHAIEPRQGQGEDEAQVCADVQDAFVWQHAGDGQI